MGAYAKKCVNMVVLLTFFFYASVSDHGNPGQGFLVLAWIGPYQLLWYPTSTMNQLRIYGINGIPRLWMPVIWNRLMAGEIFILQNHSGDLYKHTLRGGKVSRITYTYPHKPLRKIEVVICPSRLTVHFVCGRTSTRVTLLQLMFHMTILFF